MDNNSSSRYEFLSIHDDETVHYGNEGIVFRKSLVDHYRVNFHQKITSKLLSWTPSFPHRKLLHSLNLGINSHLEDSKLEKPRWKLLSIFHGDYCTPNDTTDDSNNNVDCCVWCGRDFGVTYLLEGGGDGNDGSNHYCCERALDASYDSSISRGHTPSDYIKHYGDEIAEAFCKFAKRICKQCWIAVSHNRNTTAASEAGDLTAPYHYDYVICAGCCGWRRFIVDQEAIYSNYPHGCAIPTIAAADALDIRLSPCYHKDPSKPSDVFISGDMLTEKYAAVDSIAIDDQMHVSPSHSSEEEEQKQQQQDTPFSYESYCSSDSVFGSPSTPDVFLLSSSATTSYSSSSSLSPSSSSTTTTISSSTTTKTTASFFSDHKSRSNRTTTATTKVPTPPTAYESRVRFLRLLERIKSLKLPAVPDYVNLEQLLEALPVDQSLLSSVIKKNRLSATSRLRSQRSSSSSSSSSSSRRSHFIHIPFSNANILLSKIGVPVNAATNNTTTASVKKGQNNRKENVVNGSETSCPKSTKNMKRKSTPPTLQAPTPVIVIDDVEMTDSNVNIAPIDDGNAVDILPLSQPLMESLPTQLMSQQYMECDSSPFDCNVKLSPPASKTFDDFIMYDGPEYETNLMDENSICSTTFGNTSGCLI